MLSKWSWVFGVVIVHIATVVFVSRNHTEISNCPQEQEGLKYHGIVEDCCCDYETVDGINKEVLHPLLQKIVRRPFFWYFKLKMWCDCPFWPRDRMCRLRDCGVNECPEHEFNISQDGRVCQEGKREAAVNRDIEAFIRWMDVDHLWIKIDPEAKAFKGWMEVDNPWTNDDETDHAELTYVNLQLNHVRYIGYTGPSPRRIWDAIYLESCQKYQFGDCQEKRILYKLISGLHSSISIHIAAHYLLDEKTDKWGLNLSLLYDSVLKYPGRVKNLYFTFLFVLQSVTKAADYLAQANYDTRHPWEDLDTRILMLNLLDNAKLKAA